jgi:threonine aldolase
VTSTADFRSDTVTKPTDAMRKAMAEATVGDDVLDGDPTVGKLEARACAWLGKEAAMFVPSGTMANQIAIGVWTSPGDEIIVESSCHVLSYESGAIGALHGVQTRTLDGHKGALDPKAVAAAIRPDFVHCPPTSLICLEQTHMSSGGSVLPMACFEGVAAVAAKAGVPVHLDGARLAHATVASGLAAPLWTQHVASVSLCLSKGLGAPVGSILAGDADFIQRALRVRKRFGGWMRQSGVLAAPALLALDDGPDGGLSSIGPSHALAKDVAKVLNAYPFLSADPAQVETNLVVCRVEVTDRTPGGAPELAERLTEAGAWVMALSPDTLRFVTHRDLNSTHVALLEAALANLLGGA